MPAKTIEPLKKITVDLFLADVDYLRQNADKFSEEVREAVRERVIMIKAQKQRMTLGDLDAR